MTVGQKLEAAVAYLFDGNTTDGGLKFDTISSLCYIHTEANNGTSSGVPSNKWFNFRFGYLDAYTNISFNKAMVSLSKLYALIGENDKADQYAAVAKQHASAFNDRFWNETTQRYIGCIDKNNVSYDYGFTFLNLEAIEAGIADEAKAQAIFSWLDGERIIDPFHGQDDLNRRIISCVGNPDDRFGEDALRILRAMRFASTYGFAIEEKTSQAIHRNKEKLLNIAAERIQTELCKMLCGRGVLQILLEYSDVISVIIPEMSPCIGFDQNNKYHEYTVYDHICHAVENCGLNDIVIKLSLFLHDIGKPCCYTTDENGGHFYGHGVYSRDLAEKVLDRLRFDNKTKHDVLELVLFHDAVIEPTPKTVRRWLNKIGELQFSRLVEIRMADILAHKESTQQSRIERCVSLAAIAYEIVEQNQCFSLKDLQISGKDVMELLNIAEGKRVGFVLNKVLDAVIDGSLKNERVHIVNYLNENKEVFSCEFSC